MVRLVTREGPRLERAVQAARGGGSPAPSDHLACRYQADGAPGPPGWGTFQLDGPGIWLWALGRHILGDGRAPGRGPVDDGLEQAVALVARYLAAHWQRPCDDAWEEHPERVHTSTLGAILAGLRAAHRLGAADSTVRAAIPALEERLRVLGRVCGWLPKWSGTDAVDGSLLWLGPLYGLFEPDDPLWARTLARIETDLRAVHGGVYRYRHDTFYGGGEWPVLTASLGLAYVERGEPGDRNRADECLSWIETQADIAGDLPEQSSCHPLQPDMVQPWLERWGPVARPLVWSHAMDLLLRLAIGAPVIATGTREGSRSSGSCT